MNCWSSLLYNLWKKNQLQKKNQSKQHAKPIPTLYYIRIKKNYI